MSSQARTSTANSPSFSCRAVIFPGLLLDGCAAFRRGGENEAVHGWFESSRLLDRVAELGQEARFRTAVEEACCLHWTPVNREPPR